MRAWLLLDACKVLCRHCRVYFSAYSSLDSRVFTLRAAGQRVRDHARGRGGRSVLARLDGLLPHGVCGCAPGQQRCQTPRTLAAQPADALCKWNQVSLFKQFQRINLFELNSSRFPDVEYSLFILHRMYYSMQVYCENKFYGADCTTNCTPRDDAHGHYSCHSLNGTHICNEGT